MLPTPTKSIPYEDLKGVNAPFFDKLRASFDRTLTSGWYVLGQNVSDFEAAFAAHNGVRFCIGVASGLDALTLSLVALNMPKGSEVLVPSNTYIASILSILQAGLVPVLVEPDSVTYNLDPLKIESAITPRTKAMLPVHLYGKPCDMGSLMALAKTHSLYVVEDCAQAHDAAFQGQKVGTFGDCGAFSFYPTKNLGALGDAGAILTNSAELAAKLRQLRNYGSSKKYHNDCIGFNSRLDEVQAGFLNVKLPFLENISTHKRQLADLYKKGLSSVLVKPSLQPEAYDVFHIYNILTPKRDELKLYLAEQGITTEVHYPVAPHFQPALKDMFPHAAYPISEKIHAQTLSLPISYTHTQEDIERVVEAINKFVRIYCI